MDESHADGKFDFLIKITAGGKEIRQTIFLL